MKKAILHTFVFVFLTGLLMFLPGTSWAQTQEDLFDTGVQLYKKGEYQQAIDTFSRVIDASDEHLRAFRLRGSSYMKLNIYDLAIKDFEAAVALSPEKDGVHSDLGTAWYYAKEYSKALDNYNKEIKKGHHNHLVYFNRALCLEQLGKIDLALDDIEASLQIKPEFYWALCYKGNLLVKKNMFNGAADAYQRAIAVESKDSYAREKLAQLNARIKETAPKPSAAPHTRGWTIQSGAFLVKDNAVKLAEKLNKKGIDTKVVEIRDSKDRQWYLVRSGFYPNEETAKKAVSPFKGMGIQAVVRPTDNW